MGGRANLTAGGPAAGASRCSQLLSAKMANGGPPDTGGRPLLPLPPRCWQAGSEEQGGERFVDGGSLQCSRVLSLLAHLLVRPRLSAPSALGSPRGHLGWTCAEPRERSPPPPTPLGWSLNCPQNSMLRTTHLHSFARRLLPSFPSLSPSRKFLIFLQILLQLSPLGFLLTHQCWIT